MPSLYDFKPRFQALLRPGAHPLLAGGFALLAAASEAAGLCGTATGAGRRYDGPLGKSDRAAALGVLAIAAAAGVSFADWIDWMFAALAAMGRFGDYPGWDPEPSTAEEKRALEQDKVKETPALHADTAAPAA